MNKNDGWRRPEVYVFRDRSGILCRVAGYQWVHHADYAPSADEYAHAYLALAGLEFRKRVSITGAAPLWVSVAAYAAYVVP